MFSYILMLGFAMEELTNLEVNTPSALQMYEVPQYTVER